MTEFAMFTLQLNRLTELNRTYKFNASIRKCDNSQYTLPQYIHVYIIYILDARVSVFTRTHNYFYELKASERNKHESEISFPYCTTSVINCLLYIGYFSERVTFRGNPAILLEVHV